MNAIFLSYYVLARKASKIVESRQKYKIHNAKHNV